jgi:hypothetical protein
MYILKRSTRADKSRMGDVIPLGQLRSLVELTPVLGAKADNRLTKETSAEYCDGYRLDKFFDKETFWALHSHKK